MKQQTATGGSAVASNAGGARTLSTLATITALSSVTQQNAGFDAEAANPVIGDRMALMMSDANSCLIGLFALFASNNEKSRRRYFNSLAFAYQKPFADKVQLIHGSMGNEFKSNPMAIIVHAGDVLRNEVKPENRRHMMKNLEILVAIEEEITLVNYACLTLLRRKLEVDHQTLKEVVTEGDNLLKLKNHVPDAAHTAVLLSLLIEASGNTDERNLAQFHRVMSAYSKDQAVFRSSSEKGIVKAMREAFDTMSVQPIMMRDAFLEHCRDVIVNDFEVTRREELLLNLFAAALDAHLPAHPPAFDQNNLQTGTMG